MAENYLMISRYTPLGLLCILLFFTCTTQQIKKIEEIKEIEPVLEEIPQNLEEIVNDLISKYIDRPEVLIEKLIEVIDDNNFEYHLLIASLKLKLSDYGGAKKVIESVPHFGENLGLFKMYIISQMSLNEDYEENLNKLLSLDPGNTFALNTFVKINIKNGNINLAQEYLIKSLEVDDENSDTFELLGDFYLAKVDKLNLKDKKVLNSKEEKIVTDYYNLSLKYYLKSKKTTDAGLYVKLSNVYNKLGKDLEAVKALNNAIKLDPEDEWNYYDRGKLYFYLGSKEKALSDFLKAYSFNPEHFFTNVFLARIFFESNKFEESLSYYTKVLQINPKYSPAYKDLSVIYYILGDKGRSLNYIISLYNTKKDRDPLLPLYLVNSLIDLGQIDQAKNILENLVKHEKTGTMKGIYNYLLDPKHTGDQVLNDALTLEDLYLRKRLTYYISEALERDGVHSISNALLREVADSNVGFESKLAKYKLGEINE